MSEASPEALLQRVIGALDALVESGMEYDGLFPSMIDRSTGAMLTDVPEPIDGQRAGDRSYRGSNLMHDEATLLTMVALAEALDQPAYEEAVRRYLQHFATHCTGTASGLFPWGEHSFWDLDRRIVGDSHWHRDPERRGQATHDHLRAAPLWLWDRLAAANPACLQGFADGLDNHWTVPGPESAAGADGTGEPLEYIRHAAIEAPRGTYHPRGARSCDFPRHGGFFIVDWARAWQDDARPETLTQIRRMVDSWWPKRDERDLLLIESRSPADDAHFHGTNAPGQTLSLAVSLLEAAPLLEAGGQDALASTMRQRAAAYIDGFLAAPHDLLAGVFVILSKREGNTVHQAMPVWGSVYGVWPASYVALTCLLGYRQTGDERLLAWARAVGERYAVEPLPDGVAAPAMDAGLGLGLLADLYDVTGEASWLNGARQLAARLLPVYFADTASGPARLPAGAAGIDWYESQMGPGFLLHGLARTALLTRDGADCALPADYTAR